MWLFTDGYQSIHVARVYIYNMHDSAAQQVRDEGVRTINDITVMLPTHDWPHSTTFYTQSILIGSETLSETLLVRLSLIMRRNWSCSRTFMFEGSKTCI